MLNDAPVNIFQNLNLELILTMPQMLQMVKSHIVLSLFIKTFEKLHQW